MARNKEMKVPKPSILKDGKVKAADYYKALKDHEEFMRMPPRSTRWTKKLSDFVWHLLTLILGVYVLISVVLVSAKYLRIMMEAL